MVQDENKICLWGIYHFEDNKGYQRLAIDKKGKYSSPIANFSLLVDAHRTLWKLVKNFELHPVLCFLDNTVTRNFPEVNGYNESVQKAIMWLDSQKETFLIREKTACILVEEGKFYGMGELPIDTDISVLAEIKSLLVEYPENEVMRSMIRNFAEKYPGNVVKIA